MSIRLETFITLDETLTQRLLPAWRKHALPIAQKVGEAVERDDIEEANRLIATLDLSVVLRKGKKDLRLFGMMALIFGATRLSDEKDTVFRGKKNPKILQESDRHFGLTIESLTKEVQKGLRVGIRQWQEQQIKERDRAFKAPRIRSFVSFSKQTVGRRGKTSLQLASSLHMSRLSAWGYTEEAKAKGFTHYRVTEQLDNRTCPVCQVMDGKVFPVQPARNRLDTVLRIDDPASLSSINPWPKQDVNSVARLRRMGAQDIINSGWDTPPYHPNCRGLLTGITRGDKVPNLVDTRPDTPDFISISGVTPNTVENVGQAIVTGMPEAEIVRNFGVPLAVVDQVRQQLEAKGVEINAIPIPQI